MKCRFAKLAICALLISIAAQAQVQSSTGAAQASRSATAKILSAQAPALTLNADNRSPSIGQNVRFTATWNREVAPKSYHFDFGDGQSIDTQQATADHTYLKAGAYAARVRVQALTTTPTMLPPPVTSNDVPIQVTPSAVAVSSVGIYQAKMPVAKATATLSSPPAAVSSNPPPQETFIPPVLTLTANNQNPQPNQDVHFTATWNRSVYRFQYLFDWGDGQTTGSRDPAADHSYAQPGSYRVSVTASVMTTGLAVGASAVRSNELLITVGQPPATHLPVLRLSADNLNPQTGDTVHFTGRWAANKYPASGYVFDWGDGQTSETTTLTADHFYAASGTYRVHVTARPLQGQEFVGGRQIVSNELLLNVAQPPAPPPPVAPKLSLTANTFNPQANQRVHFTASFDQPVGSTRYRYAWGDGQSYDSEAPQADHAYSVPRSYKVQVLATGIVNDRSFRSESNELVMTVAATALPPPPAPQPSATLNADHHSARIGDSIRFSAFLNPQAPSLRYHFVFGDGNQQDSQSNEVVYSYGLAGHFQPRVSISIEGQNQVVTSPAIQLAISKVPPPVAPRLRVEVKSENLQPGIDVVLQASLAPAQEGASFQFDWGDGSPLSRAGVNGVSVHRYAQQGRYPVLVSASIEEGYLAPEDQRLILVILPPSGGPTLLEWILIAAGAAVMVDVVRRIYRKYSSRRLGLHYTAFPDAGVHTVTHVNPSLPHMSLTLRSGMDSAEHEMVLPKRAVA